MPATATLLSGLGKILLYFLVSRTGIRALEDCGFTVALDLTITTSSHWHADWQLIYYSGCSDASGGLLVIFAVYLAVKGAFLSGRSSHAL